jgi:putative transcriptional regulator
MPPANDDDAPHAITVHLDEILAARGVTMTALAERVGITLANMSILKTGKARAIRFSTLSAICAELDCQPGDILRHESSDQSGQV